MEFILGALVRYIHRNPVRAGIVQRPEDYRWSSHRTYLGSDSIIWITKGTTLALFALDEVENDQNTAESLNLKNAVNLMI